MRKFIAKPPVLEAAYWDGTLNSLSEIREIMRLKDGYPAEYILIGRGDAKDGSIRFYLDIDGLPMKGGKDANTRMVAGCWLVHDPIDGRFEIMGDYRFRKLYSEAEE